MRTPTLRFALPALAIAATLSLTGLAAPASASTFVSSTSELTTAFGSTGEYQLSGPVSDDSLTLTVPAGAKVTLNLAGFSATVRSVALGAGAKLVITDTTEAAGTFTADASQSSKTAGIRTTDAEFMATGNVKIVAKGGSGAAAIGGTFQGNGGITKIWGNVVVTARAGVGAAAIGAGENGSYGGSYLQGGDSLVTVTGSGSVSVLGAVSSTGTIEISSGTFTISANSRLAIQLQHGDSASNAGTIQVAGSLTGGPIENTGAIIISGSGTVSGTVSGSKYTLTFDAGSGTLTSNSPTITVLADTLALAGITLPSATWAGHALDGWKFGNVPFTAATKLSSMLGAGGTATLNAVWKDVAGVSLGSSTDTVAYGQQPTFTATVTGATSGSVEFFAGTTSLGVKALSGATAVLTPTAKLPVGVYQITAKYSGSTAAGTSLPVELTVVRATSVTSLEVGSTSMLVGSSALLTARLSAGATGTISFWANGVSLGPVPVDSGVASIGATGLAVGTYRVRADYSGDVNFQPSQSVVGSLTVTSVVETSTHDTSTSNGSSTSHSSGAAIDTTTTAVFVSKPKVTFGTAATVTAHVGGSATGTVTFSSGGAILGTAPVASGFASLSLSMLASGSHGILASYSGDATHAASTSTAAIITIAKATTKATVTAKKFKKGSKPKVTVKLKKLANGAVATGKVAIYVGKKKVKTVTVTKATTKVTLPKKYTKSITVSVKFLGSKNVKAVKSKAKKVIAK